MSVDYLLDLDPIGYIALMINTSAEVPSSGVLTTAPSNDHEREAIASILEVFLVYVAMNHWHTPLLTLDTAIEVTYQEVVPHHLVVPGLECRQLLLLILSLFITILAAAFLDDRVQELVYLRLKLGCRV